MTRAKPDDPDMALSNGQKNPALHLDDLDFARHKAAYQGLASALRSAIARGQFGEGDRLPTEAELSDRYDLSRQTVRRALQELVAEGLVFRVRGRGTFPVSNDASTSYFRPIGSIDDLLALSRDAVFYTVEPLTRRTHVAAAGRLRTASDQIYSGTFARKHEGIAVSVTVVYLPLEVGRRIVERGAFTTREEISERTIISWIEETNPEPIAVAHQSIIAAPAPAEYAGMVGSKPGDPALQIDRLYMDRHGVGLELAVSYFNPERYSYRIELRRNASAPTRQVEILPKPQPAA
jgi:GntR family transcriptional regulator